MWWWHVVADITHRKDHIFDMMNIDIVIHWSWCHQNSTCIHRPFLDPS